MYKLSTPTGSCFSCYPEGHGCLRIQPSWPAVTFGHKPATSASMEQLAYACDLRLPTFAAFIEFVILLLGVVMDHGPNALFTILVGL